LAWQVSWLADHCVPPTFPIQTYRWHNWWALSAYSRGGGFGIRSPVGSISSKFPFRFPALCASLENQARKLCTIIELKSSRVRCGLVCHVHRCLRRYVSLNKPRSIFSWLFSDFLLSATADRCNTIVPIGVWLCCRHLRTSGSGKGMTPRPDQYTLTPAWKTCRFLPRQSTSKHVVSIT